MIGPVILFAANLAPLPVSATPAAALAQPAPYQASSRATARTSIRIVSGVKFGPGHAAAEAAAVVRHGQLTDQAGQLHPAFLLEFQ